MIIRQIKNTKTRTLFLVTNEDGDIVADTDKDTAIARMSDSYGGNRLSTALLRITIPVYIEPVFELDLPEATEVIDIRVPNAAGEK